MHSTVYPKKYAHGFVVLCFAVVIQSFIMNSHEVFIHIHQGCFAGTGAIVRLPQCQWSKPDGYGKISQCITTTKHSKAKSVCIFLGINCTLLTHCERNPIVTGGFPSQRASVVKLQCFICCLTIQAVDQTVDLSFIWDTMTLMWHHCNRMNLQGWCTINGIWLKKFSTCWVVKISKSCNLLISCQAVIIAENKGITVCIVPGISFDDAITTWWTGLIRGNM